MTCMETFGVRVLTIQWFNQTGSTDLTCTVHIHTYISDLFDPQSVRFGAYNLRQEDERATDKRRVLLP